MVSNIFSVLGDLGINPKNRKLLGEDYGRRLTVEEENPRPDIVVAKDGSGDYGTVTEAVKMVPNMSKKGTVIYVEEGVYVENVAIGANCWNVMMYGDGMNRSIVSFGLNHVDGSTTYSSATFGKFNLILYKCVLI